MAQDFIALQTETLARGFDYLDTTRLKRFLNDAMHVIDDMEPWPYLQATSTGAAPLTVSDLGRVESVVSPSRQIALDYMERATITEYWGDLTLTGTPIYYYLTGGTVVNVFPASTASITVRYTKFAADLSANGDVPLMPDRYRGAIIEYACATAYRDKDNWQEAGAAQTQGDLIVARMRDFYDLQPGAAPQQVVHWANSEDS